MTAPLINDPVALLTAARAALRLLTDTPRTIIDLVESGRRHNIVQAHLVVALRECEGGTGVNLSAKHLGFLGEQLLEMAAAAGYRRNGSLYDPLAQADEMEPTS